MDSLRWIDDNRDSLISAADQVWDFAETLYQEEQSAALLSGMLEEYGFHVKRGIAGIPTAFTAEYGEGGPLIGILGEYDALPGLSQDRVPYQKPLQVGGNGHGCGHNLFGVACLAAATVVKQAIQAGEVKGTVRFYGCPAEEGGSAKTFMARDGFFKDVDVALTWHPNQFNAVLAENMLATVKALIRFRGRTAHAAVDPYNGRSALDAVELMNVGVNFLREHMIPEARIHYIITHGGGAVNVVPGFAEAMYLVRAPQPAQLNDLFARVKDIARGAALMTGTQAEVEVVVGTSNLLLNDTLIDVLQQSLERIPPPQYDETEVAFAREIAGTFPPASAAASLRHLGLEGRQAVAELHGSPLAGIVMPLHKSDYVKLFSSDVGDTTWVVPTGQIGTVCHAIGTPGHSWQITAQGGMSIGHKGMLHAGKVLGTAALELLHKPELVAQARAEFEARIRETPYICPIPAGVKPPLNG